MFLPKVSQLPSTLKPLVLNDISKVVKIKLIYAWNSLTEKRTCYMPSLYSDRFWVISGAGDIFRDTLMLVKYYSTFFKHFSPHSFISAYVAI